MLILTQGKNEVVNLDSVEMIFWEPETACYNAGWNIFARGASGKNMALGRYESGARAQEVLQEIVKAYKTSPVIIDTVMFLTKVNEPVVYEMPKG